MKQKGRWKLCNINQIGQSTTWKKAVAMEFKKYAECKLWAMEWNLKSIQNVGFEQTFRKCIKIFISSEYFFVGKKPIVKSAVWLWLISNKYIYNIYDNRVIHRCYVRADSLLFLSYCWRCKFKMKVLT